MATVPAQADTGTYGISVTATGITIESITITETPQTETVPDQANAVVSEITYDKRVDLLEGLEHLDAGFINSMPVLKEEM